MGGSNLITRGLKANIRAGLGNSGTFSPVSITELGRFGLGRVTRVVLGPESCTEEEWVLYQKSQALYGVFYRELRTGTDGQLLELGAERFAYCSQPALRRIPIVNEIVTLKTEAAPDLVAQDNNIFQQKVYWETIVPAWNHPHLNMLPDLQKDTVEEDPYFKDQGNEVNPLQLCPGDVTLEGRHGATIRLGGTWYDTSPVATKDTNGKAYAILRAGQGADNSGQGDRTIYEDVNEDGASLYLTTDHIVPLEQACSKRSAWKNSQITEAKDYNKPQILLTSDRVWLNGRDDVELSAKNYIGVTTNQVNIDGQEQVSLDATKIYLGNRSQTEQEPVLKGATTTKMLTELVNQFITLLDTIIKAGTEGKGDPGIFIGTLQAVSKSLLPILKLYKSQLPTLHSKKIFVE